MFVEDFRCVSAMLTDGFVQQTRAEMEYCWSNVSWRCLVLEQCFVAVFGVGAIWSDGYKINK